jgi:hypothetical protein
LRFTPPANSRHLALSAWLPNDLTYLPICSAADGLPAIEVSAVVPRSDLH